MKIEIQGICITLSDDFVGSVRILDTEVTVNRQVVSSALGKSAMEPEHNDQYVVRFTGQNEQNVGSKISLVKALRFIFKFDLPQAMRVFNSGRIHCKNADQYRDVKDVVLECGYALMQNKN
jgi:hypothetical protein